MKMTYVVWAAVAVGGYFVLRSAGLLAFLGVPAQSVTSNPTGGSAGGTVPQDAFQKVVSDISSLFNNNASPNAQLAPKTT